MSRRKLDCTRAKTWPQLNTNNHSTAAAKWLWQLRLVRRQQSDCQPKWKVLHNLRHKERRSTAVRESEHASVCLCAYEMCKQKRIVGLQRVMQLPKTLTSNFLNFALHYCIAQRYTPPKSRQQTNQKYSKVNE